MAGYSSVYKYKYNGKEYQDELGLNFYDYGARNYDPALGRYFTMDNFSEAFYNINPYQYTANNPVKFIDVNGDYIYIWQGGTRFRYDNGKIFSQDKDKGTWDEYQAEEGSYVAQILEALNGITMGDSNSFGAQFLRLFENENINVDIGINVSKQLDMKDRNITFDDYIYTSFNQKGKVQTTDGLKDLIFHITLAHELAHGLSYNLFNSSERDKPWIKANSENGLVKDVKQDEIFATMFENMIRAEQGLPIRTHYILGGSSMEESRIIKKSKLQNPFHTQYEPTEQALKIWNNIVRTRK
ncbi:RHS repeat-associated core domain-containing protein [Flavobacterium tibetense]|nr:RHS repeat-associated core domain-containing protein [Flavobacterium tibetense]